MGMTSAFFQQLGKTPSQRLF